MMTEQIIPITLTVNGNRVAAEVPSRLLLSDFLRHNLGLTGTHVSCEIGVCGVCTVLVDGKPVRSCLTLAVQADAAEIESVESLSNGDELSPLQTAFWHNHSLQCGFCTPGFLMTLTALFRRNPSASDEEILEALDNVLCRCTGYVNIIKAAKQVRDQLNGDVRKQSA
jgi:carbon-monoxide dehydrogenase small subunit